MATKESKRETTLVLVGLLILAAVAAVVYIFWIEPWWNRTRLLHQDGAPAGSAFGEGVVALIDSVDVERDKDEAGRNRTIDRLRVTVLSLENGQKVGEHLFEYGEKTVSGECAAPVSGRVWCSIGELAVHDAKTFARLGTAKELIQKANLGKPLAQSWTVEGAEATWLLEDGRAAVIDAATLSATLSDKIPAALQPNVATNRPRENGYLTQPGRCDTTKIDPRGWVISTEGTRATVKKGKGAGKPGETYLQPQLLEVGEEAAYVVHHASMEKQNDHAKVSRVSPDGSAVWTVDLKAPCESWTRNGKSLVLVTTALGDRAVSIDMESGKITWRQER